MEKASRVMYTIANFFTWLLIILGILCIVGGSLGLSHVKNFEEFGTREIAWGIWTIVINVILICLARIAKSKNTSKFWDVLFLIIGFVAGNIFYFLGGLFGLIARR
jgi:hypothetical protein